jgi:flotillin
MEMAMTKAIMWLLFCLALILSPLIFQNLGISVDMITRLLISGAGLLFLIVGAVVITITKLYVRTKANEAFVRTGKGGALVILDGGALVIPVLHEVVRVPLETMRLDVDRTGADALITADKLRADLKAEFYIRVQPETSDVLNAARSLGEKTFDLRSIEELVKDKLVSSLRAVAATRTLEELNAKREEFAGDTKKAVESDLRHNGLTLEAVTVSSLDQTDPSLLNPNNVFDAQGLKQISKITQEALVERNKIERDAERDRTQKNVETRQQILELERKQAEFEAGQKAEVAKIQAQKETEAKTAQILKERDIASAEVNKQRDIEQAGIAKQRDVEQAGMEAQQKVIQARRAAELTEVERAKAVETAGMEKLAAVAAAEAKRADAEKLRYIAETELMRAQQQVKTVEVTAAAEREGEQKLIAAQKLAEQDRYRKQVEADVVAYALQKEAEGKKLAAEAEYQAKTRAAQADSESATKRAEGDTSIKMVDVNVARSQVEVDAARVGVERQRVDVEAQALSNKEKFGKAAIEFELRKLQIEATKETQIATARALGEFIAKSNFTVYGDPASAQKMLDAYMKGMGLARSVDGFLAEASPATKQLLDRAGGSLVDVVRGVVERVSGRRLEDREIEEFLTETTPMTPPPVAAAPSRTPTPARPALEKPRTPPVAPSTNGPGIAGPEGGAGPKKG